MNSYLNGRRRARMGCALAMGNRNICADAHTISCISHPFAFEIRMSRNEEVSQATKGDYSVTRIGRVK